MARQRDYAAEWAARKARQPDYGKKRWATEKASAKAQGFKSPTAARRAGAKLAANTRGEPTPPPKVNVGTRITIWRLDSPYDLGKMRAGTRHVAGGEDVVIAGDIMGRSGPIRIVTVISMTDLRTWKYARIVQALQDQAAEDYGGDWSGAPVSNIQASTTAAPAQAAAA